MNCRKVYNKYLFYKPFLEKPHCANRRIMGTWRWEIIIFVYCNFLSFNKIFNHHCVHHFCIAQVTTNFHILIKLLFHDGWWMTNGYTISWAISSFSVGHCYLLTAKTMGLQCLTTYTQLKKTDEWNPSQWTYTTPLHGCEYVHMCRVVLTDSLNN